MPDNVMTSQSNGLSQRTNVYAEREMLKYAGAVIVLDKFGVKKSMPANKTDTIKFRRPRVFEAVTTPLAEGVTPKATQFAYEDVTGILRQYGQVVGITDVIMDTHEDPVLNDMVQQLGDNAGRSKEALMWGVLRSGTNVRYANGASRSAVNTTLTLAHQRAVIRDLKAQKAKKITSTLAPGPNFKTSAVEASYIAVAHTDLENDIRNLPNFVPCVEYGTKSRISDYEIGACEEVRYITSPDLNPFLDAGGTPGSSVVSTSGSAADVYPILYLGAEAYGDVSLRSTKTSQGMEPVIIPVGQRTKDDPLAQRGYAGWKFWHLCLILNDMWMVRLECAATAL